MLKDLHPYKVLIDKYLQDFLIGKKNELSKVNKWGPDVVDRLLDFVTHGKTIRGSLIILSSEMFSSTLKAQALQIAAAFELLQSAFLIHDDIFDRDRLRRGQPTFFAQYENLAKSLNIVDCLHYGQNQAISAGTISILFAFELITRIPVADKLKSKIIDLTIPEIIKVYLGQMEDVTLGASHVLPTSQDILRVYRFKTSRYTFSLPLMAGAILAQQNSHTLHLLEKFGETLGLIFQLSDDQLSMFGNPQTTGKPVGGDIREGKKTMIYYLLFQKADAQLKQKLQTIFGNQQIQSKDIRLVQQAIKQLKINEIINKEISHLEVQAHHLLQNLKINNTCRQTLSNLLEFSKSRSS